LTINTDNYELVHFEGTNNLKLTIVGKGKWKGLVACGTITNIAIFTSVDDCGNNITPPVLTILGDSTTNIYQKGKYTDVGATAVDDVDGNLTDQITTTSDVNTEVPGTYTITYTVSDSNNNISTLTRTVIVVPIINSYDYTGDYQTFTVPIAGNYKIELWGAAGIGTEDASKGVSLGGNGAYTAGTISLSKGENIYIYVGQGGKLVTSTNINDDNNYTANFNGGGAGAKDTAEAVAVGEHGFSGGGATDIRLNNGLWNDTTSLRSRIMVAAGGGGGGWSGNGTSDPYYTGGGGAGGALTGIGAPSATSSTPGTQTSGNAFGIGGNGLSGNGTGGGGGGYYGGMQGLTFAKPNASGSGGSSFISGYTGCNAIDENGNSTGGANHYSGKVFTDTQMIDGISAMSNPNGETETGHKGNGFAKITCLDAFDNSATLTIIGESSIELALGTTYSDAGATAIDDVDGDITNKIIITSDVNPNLIGTYHVTYSVTDSGNNVATKVRTVTVIPTKSYAFDYTGDYQTFTAEEAGIYEIELWGASGGNASYSGKGGYTKGQLYLNANESFSIYVGAQGVLKSTATTFNGGGGSGTPSSGCQAGYSGGGATDIRLINSSAKEKYRYVRDYANGSSANTGNHWVEIEVYDINGNLISSGKNVISSNTSLGNITALTDGVKATTPYVDGGTGPQYMEVDLGSEYDIGKVIVWHYFSDGRYYKATKTELYSEDRSKVATIYDSAHQGVYTETAAGKTMTLNDWHNYDNLKLRIMVAAGGGGGCQWYSYQGGFGGGIAGGNGRVKSVGSALGATQTTGYAFGIGQKGANSTGYSSASEGRGGGGGGYYGGKAQQSTSSDSNAAGGGGSSFISGYAGCNAIDEAGVHTGSPNHYSGKIFNNPLMIAGNSTMPNPSGGTETGHLGNGYVRIILAGRP
jgi:hypothetical protein